METRRLQVYVPGILTFPGASDNWSGKAVTHTHNNTNFYAEKCEFLVGPIDRAFGQKERSQKLQKLLLFYTSSQIDWEVVLVGHSNGADVIVQMLNWRQLKLKVSQLHLVCGACNADFEENGINGLLLDGSVEHVFVYVSGKDLALQLAHTIPGKLLGYGTLGLKGPLNIDPRVSTKVTVVNQFEWAKYGHCDCWDNSEFFHTMNNFLE